MTQPALDRLIVSNLADLDLAAQYLTNEIEPAIAECMDALVETFLRNEDLAGEATWKENLSIWLAFKGWHKQGDHSFNDYKCYFDLNISLEKWEEKDSYWLTQLLGIGDRTLGLRWTRNDVGKRSWRKLVGQQQEIIAKLRSCGFVYEESEGTFFLPVRVDQAALVQALIDESPGLALQPLTDAIQICIGAKPDFDALLAATAGVD